MLNIELERLDTHFSPESGYCYVHARATQLPDKRMVMTMQKLRLSGSDIFSGLEMTIRDPQGEWSPIMPCPTLSRRPWEDGAEIAMCDATPFFHNATQKLLLTGHTVIYKNDEILPGLRPRHTAWSIFDAENNTWTPYRLLDMPDGFFNCGAGCSQIHENPDGTLLIPAYVRMPTKKDAAFVMRCSFDGTELKLLEYGNLLKSDTARGFGEPSIVHHQDTFYLCIRHDETSYISVSKDGLHFNEPIEWLFDDGTPLGCYNTQQHWLSLGGKLYLIYTRRAGFNDHIFRHRAPLFIAEIDTEKLRVIRNTEQIAVPARGARLGNFCCAKLSETEGIVVAAEWMQTTGPDHFNFRRCMEYGSDNSIFIAHLHSL